MRTSSLNSLPSAPVDTGPVGRRWQAVALFLGLAALPVATHAQTIPAAPQGLIAHPLSSTEIALEWEDLADNETGFRIARRAGTNGEWVLIEENLAADSTHYDDAGLEPSSDYFYRVWSVNEAGIAASGLARAITDTGPFGERTIIFQDGVNNYEAARDVGLSQTSPSVGNTSTYVWIDNNSASDESQAVLDFDGIYGPALSQVPPDAVITRAILRIYLGTVENAQSNREIPFRRMLVPWDEASSWDSPTWGGNGIDADNQDAAIFVDAVKVFTNPGNFHDVDVTRTLRAWAAGLPKHGWFISTPTSDGYAYYTTHNPVVEERPALLLSFDTDPANLAPTVSALHGPAAEDPDLKEQATLDFTVADANFDPLEVTLMGRQLPLADRDFTVVVLPDTQFYPGRLHGGTPAIFVRQVEWIVENREALNIAFVLHMGDIVQNGDLKNDGSSNQGEWVSAANAMYRLEDPVTTRLAEGIPYGVAVGNHDQEPIWDPEGTTLYYNQYFGIEHFQGKSYYGGHHGENNDNYFQLYSVGSHKFLSLSLEYRGTADPDVLEWADALLKAYPDRRAILTTHHLVGAGDPAQWSAYGAVIFETLKDNPNLGLMLGGHIHGEGRRTDVYEGRAIHSILQDYQGYEGGGNGYLRIFTFSPRFNEIRVETYSPWRNRYEDDENSTFTLPYDFGVSLDPFVELSQFEGVASGERLSFDWVDLEEGAEYEWYAVLSDGRKTTTTDTMRFQTVHPFADWIKTYYASGSSEAGWLADPDRDGQGNVLEFLFETDPTDGSFDPHMPTAVLGEGRNEIHYRRRIDPRLLWYYEISTDLVTWAEPDTTIVTVSESVEPDGTGSEKVTLIIDSSAETVFWRLGVR